MFLYNLSYQSKNHIGGLSILSIVFSLFVIDYFYIKQKRTLFYITILVDSVISIVSSADSEEFWFIICVSVLIGASILRGWHADVIRFLWLR